MKAITIALIAMKVIFSYAQKTKYYDYNYPINSTFESVKIVPEMTQVLWAIEPLDEIVLHSQSELYKILAKQKRVPLIYKQTTTDEATLDITIEEKYLHHIELEIILYSKRGNKPVSRGLLKPGNNQIRLHGITGYNKLAVVAKSIALENINLSMHIKKITTHSNIPAQLHGIKPFGEKVEFDIHPYPNLDKKLFCSVPFSLWSDHNWHQIKEYINNVGGLCDLKERLKLLNQEKVENSVPAEEMQISKVELENLEEKYNQESKTIPACGCGVSKSDKQKIEKLKGELDSLRIKNSQLVANDEKSQLAEIEIEKIRAVLYKMLESANFDEAKRYIDDFLE